MKTLSFRLQCSTYSVILLLVICLVYGFLSTPTPDSIGPAEVLIGLGIIFLVFNRYLAALFDLSFKSYIPSIVRLVFLYFLIAPTVVGIIVNGNEFHDFIRDLIPLFYFFLPLFLFSYMEKQPFSYAMWLMRCLFLVGIGFILQFYLDPTVSFANIGTQQMTGLNRDNPFQDPAAVFACALAGGLVVHRVMNGQWLRAIPVMVAFIVCMAVYLATISRAPIGLTLFVMILVFFYDAMGSRRKALKFIISGALIIFGTYWVISSGWADTVWQLISFKTRTAGVLNGRDQEAMAVLKNITSVPVLLFGEGWGGLIANPVVGGMKLRFVHNMFFYFLFKTGLIGLILMFIYLAWCLRVFFAWRIIARMDVILNIALFASVAPMVVGGLLEASFKTLSFGLLLSWFVALKMAEDFNTKWRSGLKNI